MYNLSNKEIELTFSEFPNKVNVDEVVEFTCHIKNKR
jgi:hypothetical protein